MLRRTYIHMSFAQEWMLMLHLVYLPGPLTRVQ